jgi:hypothetical protein
MFQQRVPSSMPPQQRASGGVPLQQQPGNPPARLDLDRKRIALILDINTELLRLVLSINDGDQKRECLLRVQANLAFLASLADRSRAGAGNPHPQILTPPPGLPQFIHPYRQLQGLFPETAMFQR